jgi:hypothetical protein
MDIQECLKDKPDGLSLADVSILTKTDVDATRIALKNLVIKGVVGEKGKTRGHRYFLIQGTSIVVTNPPTVEILPEQKPLEKLVDKIYKEIDGDAIAHKMAEFHLKRGIPSDAIKEACVDIARKGRIYRPYLVRDLMERFPDVDFSDIAVSVRDFTRDLQDPDSFLMVKYPGLIYEKDSACYSMKPMLEETV